MLPEVEAKQLECKATLGFSPWLSDYSTLSNRNARGGRARPGERGASQPRPNLASPRFLLLSERESGEDSCDRPSGQALSGGGSVSATTIEVPGGGYRYIPGVFQYSAGVAALDGFRIERAEFLRPVPLAAGFASIE